MKSYFLISIHCTTYLYNILVATLMLVRCQNSSRRTTGNIHPTGSAKASYAKCRSVKCCRSPHLVLCWQKSLSCPCLLGPETSALYVEHLFCHQGDKETQLRATKNCPKKSQTQKSVLNHHLREGGLPSVDYSYCYLRENGLYMRDYG